MNGKFLLGVDGGKSKTECAILELGGTRRMVARGGGSSHEGVGLESAGLALRAVVLNVLQQGNISRSDIVAACFAMAGMDVPPDQDNINKAMVEPLGLSCPIIICNDAWAGFRAGSASGVGMCVSVGTGLTFCGRNYSGDQLQFEYPAPPGIDFFIRNALIAEYYGIGPKCSFTSAYLQAVGLATLEEFFLSHYPQCRDSVRSITRTQIVEARRTVFHPATFHDPATCDMLQKFAHSLAEIMCGLGARLNFGSTAFDLVLSGSILTKGKHPALNDTLIGYITKLFPGARPVIVGGIPVDGALLMAAELLQK